MAEQVIINAELITVLEDRNEWIRRMPGALKGWQTMRDEQLLWVDTNGNYLTIGEDFMAAEKQASFQVKVYRAIRVSQVEEGGSNG